MSDIVDEDIALFLDEDITKTQTQNWNRLDKTTKLVKIRTYLENIDVDDIAIDEVEINRVVEYLQTCIDRKRMANTKEVEYDTKLSKITAIRDVAYNSDQKNFTIRRRPAQLFTHSKTVKHEKKRA